MTKQPKAPPARTPDPFGADLRIGNLDDPEADYIAVRKTSTGRAFMLPTYMQRIGGTDAQECVSDLQHTVGEIQRLRAQLDSLVLEARRVHGLSWNVIGWSTGMTGVSARLRWLSDETREKSSDHG
jgi:hypothetical protein